jgi:hypothetical protein
LIAGSLSAALLAGVTVVAFSSLPALWVWAAFVGWASYDHSGANAKALLTSSVCMVFGVVMAWLVALIVAKDVLPLPSTAASGIAAGIASFVIVFVSRLTPFCDVPATFYGFACAFAFLLMMPNAFSIDALTSFAWRNAMVCIPPSLLIGSALGVIHQRLALLLTATDQKPANPSAVRLTPPGRTSQRK